MIVSLVVVISDFSTDHDSQNELKGFLGTTEISHATYL